MDTSIHVIQPFQPAHIPADRRRRDPATKRFDLDAVSDAPGSDEESNEKTNEHPTAASIPAREEGTGEHLDVIA